MNQFYSVKTKNRGTDKVLGEYYCSPATHGRLLSLKAIRDTTLTRMATHPEEVPSLFEDLHKIDARLLQVENAIKDTTEAQAGRSLGVGRYYIKADEPPPLPAHDPFHRSSKPKPAHEKCRDCGQPFTWRTSAKGNRYRSKLDSKLLHNCTKSGTSKAH